MNNTFTEEDKQKLVDFLNFVAKRAEFPNWKTEDSITHFKLLAYLQQQLLPKIEKNILEIKRVIESTESSKE